ncbi:hypothetical protein GCM10017781_14700 [Deinococcus metalli]|uniref:Uncharacterized protein n=1 Tax=Deinococcus metalli TaxID=1141878 RepID=A0ABQ3JK89_9DEIO|nr:hypothetical protein GCM10017781_14700 [Deinococcus metalli]
MVSHTGGEGLGLGGGVPVVQAELGGIDVEAQVGIGVRGRLGHAVTGPPAPACSGGRAGAQGTFLLPIIRYPPGHDAHS